MTQLTPTPEQSAIISTANSASSLMVQAGAGCSKTTTMVMKAQRVKGPALALAFNKSIEQELAKRLPSNYLTKTMNGLGHGALARTIAASTIKLDDKKVGKLVSQTARLRRIELIEDQWDLCRKLVAGVMRQGITPGDQGTPLTPDTPDNWLAVAEDCGLNGEFEFLGDLAREVLVESNKLTRQGVISFDDQVYFPVVFGGKFPQFPLIDVDEAQDLNLLNHAMIARGLRSDGRLSVIGDDKQSIYSFRGSVNGSMAQMRRLRPQWIDLPLLTTFRCPKVIVARQQQHVPGFTAWHTNPEGKFAGVGELAIDGRRRWNWENLLSAKPAPSASIAILCRNNGPLTALAFKLIRRGVGVVMAGRDIGKGLVALSRKICPSDELPRDLTAGRVEEWRARESSLARANGKDEKVDGIDDRAECLQAVLTHAGATTAGQLRAILTQLFDRQQGLVTLSSIHRAKGLEWDTVLHLDPWRIPSRWAKRAALAGDRRQLDQELNLQYVCETRSRHTLLEANLEDFH